MKALIVGGGAREHALAWRMSLGEARELHAAPGNPGIARIATCHPVAVTDLEGQVALARQLGVELVIVGPEAPLAAGLADRLRAEGIPVFGPSSGAARIEASKSFAKELLREAGVPTARWASFDDPEHAERHAASLGRAVIKADGLAGGKGSLVAHDAGEARAAVAALMRYGIAGDAGKRVVVEELLEGQEASAIALCDGERHLMLASSRDYKRLEDAEKGPNTGGMGACSPAPMSDTVLEEISTTVFAPVLRALRERGTPFVGALYAGMMITSEGPRVLELNCRLGDPETQVLMMRLATDPAPLFAAAAAGDLRGKHVGWKSEAAVGVVLATEGYPVNPSLGDPVEGLDSLELGETLQVFHAGTREQRGQLVTAGGRVLTIGALGKDIWEARDRAYAAAAKVTFAGMQLRHDIASLA